MSGRTAVAGAVLEARTLEELCNAGPPTTAVPASGRAGQKLWALAPLAAIAVAVCVIVGWVLPVLFGWYQQVGERGSHRNSPLILSLMVAANVFCLLALILGTAAALDRFERRRRGAEEATVAERLLADRVSSLALLAAGLTHQINNPLAVVITNLDLALRDLQKVPVATPPTTTTSEMRAELQDARDGAERIGRIVKDLRPYTRDPRGHAVAVDLNAALETCLRVAGNQLHAHLRVVRQYGPIPPVAANEGRLGQALLYLLIEAARALPAGTSDREIRLVTYLDDRGRVAVEAGDDRGGTFRIALPPA